jgi:glycerophosphoryl diester phosphodiesterase
VKARGDGLVDLLEQTTWRARHPLLIAHRGGVVEPGAPENSLAAIRRAAAAGYDLVELDVRASRDGEPVLFHGDWSHTLRVSCGVDRRLGELTRAELRAIRYRETDEHVAALDEALELCAELRLGVMLDVKDSEVPAPVMNRAAALIDAHGLSRAAMTSPARRSTARGGATTCSWARRARRSPVRSPARPTRCAAGSGSACRRISPVTTWPRCSGPAVWSCLR